MQRSLERRHLVLCIQRQLLLFVIDLHSRIRHDVCSGKRCIYKLSIVGDFHDIFYNYDVVFISR
jgi:hypothetical protein